LSVVCYLLSAIFVHIMPCEHAGPHELMEMAEAHLASTPQAQWPGRRFRWSENVTGGMWASVILEIERRGDQWIVTRLDRNREPLTESDCGFRELATPTGSD
jgi:hypothetical protein